MKKNRILALLFCLIVGIITSCGSDNPNSRAEKNQTEIGQENAEVENYNEENNITEQQEGPQVLEYSELSEEQQKMCGMILEPISTAFFEYAEKPEKYEPDYFFWYALDHVITTSEKEDWLCDYYKELVWFTEEPDMPLLTVKRELVEKHAELIFSEYTQLPELNDNFIRMGKEENTFYKSVGSSGSFLQGNLSKWNISEDGVESANVIIRETQRGQKIGTVYFSLEKNTEEHPLAAYKIKSIVVHIGEKKSLVGMYGITDISEDGRKAENEKKSTENKEEIIEANVESVEELYEIMMNADGAIVTYDEKWHEELMEYMKKMDSLN